MTLGKISEYEYKQLLETKLHSMQDMLKLASYPYVSLLSQYNHLLSYEYRKIREIEDKNVFTFLRVASLCFGMGPQHEVNMFKQNMNDEPLRSAVIAARQEVNPLEKMPKFIELACKLLLSVRGDRINSLNAIDIKIDGKIPSLPFSNRQKIADEWYDHFVDIKLTGIKKVYIDLGGDVAFQFLLSSTLYSLYHFAPSRYDIRECRSENEALHKIRKIFTNHLI